MFLLDLYRFCESYESFNRQHLAAFVYKHRECDRLARSAKVTPRFFASCVSKEFLARMCTLGYLDLEKGVARSLGSSKRPFNFEFHSFDGEESRYIWEMMNVSKMSDEEFFNCKSKLL